MKQYINASDLAIHKPKKDRCGICTGCEVANIYIYLKVNIIFIIMKKEEEAWPGKEKELSITSKTSL